MLVGACEAALSDVQWQHRHGVFYQRCLNVSCHSSSPLSVNLTFTRLLLIQSDTRHTHGEADAPTCLSSATFLCLLPHKFTAGRLQETAQSALAGDPVWESLRTTSHFVLFYFFVQVVEMWTLDLGLGSHLKSLKNPDSMEFSIEIHGLQGMNCIDFVDQWFD